jgi:hypothetical protein
MSEALTAAFEPQTTGEDFVATLRITNVSDAPVDVVNPDMGRPSGQMNWPYSIETYRAALLISFGNLVVSVTDASGTDVSRTPIETWATPIRKGPIPLAPGASVDVPIPLGRFFAVEEGETYRVVAAYGEPDARVPAEGEVEAISR